MAIASLVSIVFTMGVKNFGNQFLRVKLSALVSVSNAWYKYKNSAKN